MFLTTFLSHPLVKSSKLVPVYFSSHCTGEGSAEAISNLVLCMNGNTNVPKSPLSAKKQVPKTEPGQTWQGANT